MLSENELWERVRGLSGRTVYTIERQRPNRISGVTDEAIAIADRATKPTREDIIQVYREVWQRGEITSEDLYGDQSILGHPYARKTGRIIVAVLASAVPEEIQGVRRSKTQRLSSIRLRQNLIK
ncbi:hypothetical protein ES703_32646 [subsurface metagenome]